MKSVLVVSAFLASALVSGRAGAFESEFGVFRDLSKEAAPSNCDGSKRKLCHIRKYSSSNEWIYTIVVTTFDKSEAYDFKSMSSRDYNDSQALTEAAAIKVGEQLEAGGLCTYIRGWIK